MEVSFCQVKLLMLKWCPSMSRRAVAMTNLFQNASCFQCIFGISRSYSQFMRFVRICHCFRVSFAASLHKWLEVRSRRCSNITDTQQSYFTRHFRQGMTCYDQDGCPKSTGKVMKKSTIPSSWPCQCCCFNAP